MQESLILGQEIPWRRDKLPTYVFMDFPGGSDSKESACNARDLSIIPGLEDPLRNVCQPTPVFFFNLMHIYQASFLLSLLLTQRAVYLKTNRFNWWLCRLTHKSVSLIPSHREQLVSFLVSYVQKTWIESSNTWLLKGNLSWESKELILTASSQREPTGKIQWQKQKPMTKLLIITEIRESIVSMK